MFKHLLAQYQQTIREELDLAYLPLMWLGQWLSPGKICQVVAQTAQRRRIEFAVVFRHRRPVLGKKRLPGRAGHRHVASVLDDSAAGTGLLAGQLDGRLTLSYSYLHPAIDEDWLNAVMERMDAELLESAET